jgi:hypothetical protein
MGVSRSAGNDHRVFPSRASTELDDFFSLGGPVGYSQIF